MAGWSLWCQRPPSMSTLDPFLPVTGGSFRDAKLLCALRPRSMRLARIAQSLPTISGTHAVGSLERQHPSRILGGKSADLIQLFELIECECQFDRREIVLKLVGALRTNDDRGYRRF